MAAALLFSAVFGALLLSPPGASAVAERHVVTWHKCKQTNSWRRVLEALPDSSAISMWLNNCNLTEVRSGDFDGLPPNVDIIHLYNNSIAHVDPAAFRTVPKLDWLDLQYNDLREVPVFDQHSFCPSLVSLILSYNQITEINHPKTFSGCTELLYIDIDNNVIEYIHADVFRPLSKLIRLNIPSNKITAIAETLFRKNNNLIHLNLAFNKIPYLPSDFVSKLRSAGAPLRTFYFHNNPWHCACLLELLADVRRAGVVRVVEFFWFYVLPYSGTRPVCVYYGAYPCSRQVPTGLLRRAAPRGGH